LPGMSHASSQWPAGDLPSQIRPPLGGRQSRPEKCASSSSLPNTKNAQHPTINQSSPPVRQSASSPVRQSQPELQVVKLRQCCGSSRPEAAILVATTATYASHQPLHSSAGRPRSSKGTLCHVTNQSTLGDHLRFSYSQYCS